METLNKIAVGTEEQRIEQLAAAVISGQKEERLRQIVEEAAAADRPYRKMETSNKSGCLCVSCTCTGCHEKCFGHCLGCGKPTTECNSYQTEGTKGVRT